MTNSRFLVFGGIVLAVIVCGVLSLVRGPDWYRPFVLLLPFLALGLHDLLQRRHAILRNYPIIGHFRFILESVRPEIRQYFIEGERDALPFAHDQRALVYKRAKDCNDSQPFGTVLDVAEPGYSWLSHSIRPVTIADPDFRVTVGGPDCSQPYSLSVYNISGTSFGSVSANAILAFNLGARLGGFAHDTGEGSISPYHRRHGGDLIW
ncbi:MAG: FMN-binding glutamate synthase family protein, partial [Alphaproteobacteria bacterium]|nr:FMN-binding glutamate synthase family protein [Alphaproteobacteria bacterium]